MWTCKAKEQRTRRPLVLFAALLQCGSFSVLENELFLPPRVLQCHCRAAPVMDDISDDHIAVLNHSFISAQNNIS